MTPENFDKLCAELFCEINKKLRVKGDEYSRKNAERFIAFKQAALDDNDPSETPEHALWGMKRKHHISIRQMVDEVKWGIFSPKDYILEKISDDITYNFILYGLLCEHLQVMSPVEEQEEAIKDIPISK